MTKREQAIAAFHKTATPIDNLHSAGISAPFHAWAVIGGQHYVWQMERRTQAQWRYRWLERFSYWLNLSAYGWRRTDA